MQSFTTSQKYTWQYEKTTFAQYVKSIKLSPVVYAKYFGMLDDNETSP